MSRVGVTCYEPCCPSVKKGGLAIKLQKDNGVNRKLKPFFKQKRSSTEIRNSGRKIIIAQNIFPVPLGMKK